MTSPLLCQNCGKPMSEHGRLAECWPERSPHSPSETDRQENVRLREGLRRLRNQDYDSGYTAETYADAILSGDEPSGEASIKVGTYVVLEGDDDGV